MDYESPRKGIPVTPEQKAINERNYQRRKRRTEKERWVVTYSLAVLGLMVFVGIAMIIVGIITQGL